MTHASSNSCTAQYKTALTTHYQDGALHSVWQNSPNPDGRYILFNDLVMDKYLLADKTILSDPNIYISLEKVM